VFCRHAFYGKDMQRYQRKRVLAVASGGGHWIQLCRTIPAFDDYDLAFVTTNASYRQQVAPARFHTVTDANLTRKLALILLSLRMMWILLWERPDVIVSTGAAPGYVAIRLGKMFFGAKTIWLDSIANAEELSVSGQRIGKHVDLWLTQWPHLAHAEGPHYEGSVL
jgi:hypothetical protein